VRGGATTALASTACFAVSTGADGKVIGSCPGTRACGAAGLSPCSAAVAVAEACDGKDNDCNGKTDDGPLCDDGDACTAGDGCAGGACQKVTVKVCDDQNDCTGDACDPKSGACTFLPKDGALCDDANPCTEGETCQQGACKGGKPKPCPCANSADCAASEDGDLCNGVLYCDPATKLCTLNPASVVVCADDGAPCTDLKCQPATGTCQTVALPDGATCSDGKPWTSGDACQAGACVPGPSTKLCGLDGDCAKYEDGDPCNGTLFCNKAAGICQVAPKTVVTCPTVWDTACRKNLCQPATGACKLMAVAEQQACDDGNGCTSGEACQQGACSATAGALTCACKADADCAKHEDGNLCNGTLYCNLAKGACVVNPATVVTCPFGLDTACAKAVCVKATGKCATASSPDGTACEADGSPCTPFDACQQGACTASAGICACKVDADCAGKDDANLCNGTLYCDKGKGQCVVNPATVATCPPVAMAGCAAATCDGATGVCGVESAKDGQPCDDGSPCTAGDACAKGVCAAGAYVCGGCTADAECPDDGDPCNGKEGCDLTKPIHACAAKPGSVPANGAACSDGNPCTNADGCAGGACHGKPVVCNDYSPCTDDACLAGSCAFLANAATCTDGSVCTVGDHCVNKVCKAGAAQKCDDGNACTTDACNTQLGCGSTPAPGACSDGDACTAGDGCKSGVCTSGAPLPCNDGNPCSDDGCDPAAGCTALPNAATCTDGDVCTVGDGCKAKACQPGAKSSCDDGNVCTTDGCDAKSGCKNPTNASPCSDGNACTTGDKCANAVCVAGAVTSCDDQSVCTADSCTPQKGCANAPVAGPCDDGNPCTDYDACSAGKCLGPVQLCGCGAGMQGIAVDIAGAVTVVCAPEVPVWGITEQKPGPAVDQGDGTAIDPVTGLQWQRQAQAAELNWGSARASCDALTLAGLADWRLPTRIELMSILDRTKPSGTYVSIDPNVFPATAGAPHWTAVPRADLPGEHWRVNFADASPTCDHVNTAKDATLARVRCVRGAAKGAVPADRFAVYAAKGIVYDQLTGRVWQRATATSGGDDLKGNFYPASASAYCGNLALEGEGWRMPQAREIESLVATAVANPAIDAKAFPGTSPTYYWGSQTSPYSSSYHYSPEFAKGSVCQLGSFGKYRVRCVRTCDDGNPCTKDGFDLQASACTHTVLADLSACGSGNQACFAGTCGCGKGYVAVPIDNLGVKLTVCAADAPVWGAKPSSFKDNANGTVADSATGLVWQQAPDVT